MKAGVNKYKKQQDLVDDLQNVNIQFTNQDTETDEEVFEDKFVMSEEAAERLADEAIAEDQEVEILEKPTVVKKTSSDTFTKTEKTAATSITSKKIDNSASLKKFKGSEKSPMGSREEIIREYAPLIKYIAQKIAARLPANIELDDLISSGVIGLMDAIEKYDPSRDNKFKTYAEFRIRGAILDELRAQDWVPRSIREKAKMLERTYAKIEHEKGRPATDEEVCEELKLSQEEFHDLLNQVRSVSLLSYDDLSNVSKSDRKMSMGMSDQSKTANPFSEVNSAHLKKKIAEAINDLPEKQRLVLSLYYYEDLNLKEIGKVLEVTESRVSQLHTQAILRLKAKLKTNFDEFLMIFGG